MNIHDDTLNIHLNYKVSQHPRHTFQHSKLYLSDRKLCSLIDFVKYMKLMVALESAQRVISVTITLIYYINI